MDLWFEKLGDPRTARALQSVGASYVPPGPSNPPMLAGAGAELFDIVLRMDGLGTFATELKQCLEIPLGRHRLKVLCLERVLASKLAANRAKEQLTIPVLRDALAATAALNPAPAERKAKRTIRRTKPRMAGSASTRRRECRAKASNAPGRR